MLCSQTGVGGVEGQNGTFYPIRTVRLNGRDVEDPNIGVDNVHGFVCVCGGGGLPVRNTGSAVQCGTFVRSTASTLAEIV